MSRTFATVLCLPLALIAATTASAQPIRPFSFGALKAAQAAGKPVLVDVFAPWCPTCRAQAPTIDALATDPSTSNLVILRVDFDHQNSELAFLHVNKQATLIAYKGKAEVGRALGITDPDQIKALARSALR
ncbi:thioredoxin family protein [Novosphingobium sp.]|uniref:thioredoxin family protein n=1 Tax=Novosphingobium sp. TaxID=1874826 RepID=UPI003D11B843